MAPLFFRKKMSRKPGGLPRHVVVKWPGNPPLARLLGYN
jgi:hypothetical protein